METSASASARPARDVQFSWIPTLALGASSTVAIHVHNASLSPSCCSCVRDEKKEEHEAEASSIRCHLDASIHLFGQEIQAHPIETRCVSLDYSGGAHKKHGIAKFDALIRLPVRWRDLTRDAQLVLNVYGRCGECSDVVRGICDKNNRSDLIWGTTMPFFDSYGRLRQGLQKLKLHPGLMGDGGMSYQHVNAESVSKLSKSFLSGGATPGIDCIDQEEKASHSFSRIDERKLSKDDPKWKASLILHEFNSQPTISNVSDVNGESNGNSVPTAQGGGRDIAMSWLDDLTRQRCMDVLTRSDLDHSVPKASESGVAVAPISIQRSKTAHPVSSHHDTPYLIIELPTSPITILHEEPIYPVESSTHLRGTTGSITANELIKFHSKFRESDVINDEQQSSGYGDLTTPLSPLAVETPTKKQNIPFAQSFLYPLVQTLDFEPPLADENEDNPFQDKYRILAHDLIRGLVDPGLKPDRVQRSRLERIINSPNHHLTTEEKDLLWKFRFSLVDNRRALTKFLLAVDWSVESEVVQAAELLEQWRKRSPIEVTDALKLLGRNVAFQTGLVRVV